MMPEINAAPGPYFIHLRVDAEEDYERPPPFSYEGPEMKYRFGRAMEKKFGIEVFGPTGFLIDHRWMSWLRSCSVAARGNRFDLDLEFRPRKS